MLKLLGTVGHNGAGPFPQRGYLLVALIALSSSRKLGRLELASQMWEQSPTPQALANLRYVIRKIRNWEAANGIQIIAASSDFVALTVDNASDIDAILGVTQLQATSDLERHLRLWRGELLQFEDFSGPDLEQTIRAGRDLLARHFTSAVLEAAERLGGLAAGAAFDLLDRISPFNEQVARAMMSFLSESGRPLEAASHYRKVQRRVRQELDVGVEPETDALATKLFHVSATQSPRPADHNDALHPPQDYRGLPRILILPPDGGGAGLATPMTLARSMVTDLSLYLARMRTFAVVAPFTARQLNTADPMAAGEEVGAPYVVSTRLTSDSSGARLWFALMRTGSGEILLADSVSVDAPHLPRSQGQIADGIARAMAAQVSGSELLLFRQTGEASAFVHYLLGVERLRYDLPSIRKAKRHFERAYRSSPSFAPALAMSARALNYEWLVLGRSSTETLGAAMSLALKATDMDPLAPNGHWEVGHSLLYLRRLDESLENIRTARDRAPHLADLTADEADVLVHLGRFDEAITSIDLAVNLNPLVPDEYLWVRGSALYFMEDYQRAVVTLSAMKDTMPVARLLSASFAMLGDFDAARVHRDRWLDRYPDFKVKDWATQIPIRNVEVQQRMIDGMRLAGFA